MDTYFVSSDFIKQFRRYSIVSGILLIIAGILGILLPQLMSLTVSIFIGWLFIFSGLISGYHVIRSYRKNWVAWFKPVLLLVLGILFLLFPTASIAALGLLLVVYFLLDTFAGFAAAHELKGHKGRIWMILNAILSLILAIIFLIGWPISSIWLVGLFVGISLLMDGIVLLTLGLAIHPAD